MGKIREHILLFLIWVITAIAAFEGGVIFQSKVIQNLERRFVKIETHLSDLGGRVESHEAIIRGLQKGRPLK